jgi:DNA-binding transcriptional MocR family regulator
MDPEHLRQVLQQARAGGQQMPRVLYIIPTGHNPTGSSLPMERKRAIYQVGGRLPGR